MVVNWTVDKLEAVAMIQWLVKLILTLVFGNLVSKILNKLIP